MEKMESQEKQPTERLEGALDFWGLRTDGHLISLLVNSLLAQIKLRDREIEELKCALQQFQSGN